SRRRHTRFSRDWSSDVCSSDLQLYRTLVDFSRELQEPRGYLEVSTPWIYRTTLWETSGHWTHYKDNMFLTDAGGEKLGVKPMNRSEERRVGEERGSEGERCH